MSLELTSLEFLDLVIKLKIEHESVRDRVREEDKVEGEQQLCEGDEDEGIEGNDLDEVHLDSPDFSVLLRFIPFEVDNILDVSVSLAHAILAEIENRRSRY